MINGYWENMNKVKTFLAECKRDGTLLDLGHESVAKVSKLAAAPAFIVNEAEVLIAFGETFETIDDGLYYTDRFAQRSEIIAENWERDNPHFIGGKEIVFIYIEYARKITWVYNEEKSMPYDLDCPMIEDLQAAINKGDHTSNGYDWRFVNSCIASGKEFDKIIEVFTYADRVREAAK